MCKLLKIAAVLFVFLIAGTEALSQSSLTVRRCPVITRCEDGDKPVNCPLNTADPCDCGDKENKVVIMMDGSILILLADTLCIFHADHPTTMLEEEQQVFIDLNNLPVNFLDEDGVPLVDKAIMEFNEDNPGMPYGMGGAGFADYIETEAAGLDGIIKIPYWREFGTTMEIDLNPFADVPEGAHHFEFPCNITSCPPIFTKSFEPPVITEGEPSSVIFTINRNEWCIDLPSIELNETLPAGLSIFPGAIGFTTCDGGTLLVDPNTNTIQYTGGNLPMGVMECIVSIDVTGPPGMYVNDPVQLTTSIGNSTTEAVTLQVNEAIPTLSEWGLIILLFSLSIVFSVGVKQRQIAAGEQLSRKY